MPDDADYARLQELLDRPEWSADELATAQFLLASQQRALDDADPRDRVRRRARTAGRSHLPSVLRIFGVGISTDDARSLVATLVGTGRPAALSAAARITSTLERGAGLVALEPQQRDAILHVLEAASTEGLVELRTRLGEDAAKRHRVV